MKKYILIAVISFISLSCEKKLDESQIPEIVKKSFMEKYPSATNVEWVMERDKYEAEFILDGNKKEAEFNKDGSFEKEED